MENNEPKYNAKVHKIIDLLKFKNRHEVAKELNYKTYKSLDMYMRRRNFHFDQKQQQYIPAKLVSKPPERSVSVTYAPKRAQAIMTAFEEEDADPRTIAQNAGFESHKDMAEYMKSKGFEWSIHKNNYVESVGYIEPLHEETEEKSKAEPVQPNLKGATAEGIEEYIPFLRFLYEKRDEVYTLLSGVREDGKLPRYAVPGLVRTKAIYMSDLIAKLTAEFSEEKNITQREIVEGALIEYLQKYGFKQEVESLLRK
ncbi:hypothetical protein HMPREF9372_1237 [Sporosarcina newyorkensis 2681]|uniref:Uncharacterized protein n=1 Tax=Sporosarcina newyorkensis 2681 TaxID=1027292 RepID=F9DR07_9BACL|nr:hypothetical protein [Sporosarcina newyorkensis]EGQ26757.1 hypothetical protein HMPREF9372_1237 [Sporosarcina newyorkensis 2681]